MVRELSLKQSSPLRKIVLGGVVCLGMLVQSCLEMWDLLMSLFSNCYLGGCVAYSLRGPLDLLIQV